MRNARVVLIVAASLLAPASAGAVEPSVIYGVKSGSPDLHAWANGGEVVSWQRCAGGGSVCGPLSVLRPYPWAGDRYGGAQPGETAAGTVFEVVVQRGAETVTARTPTWEGTLAPDPPTLTGNPVVGEFVQPVPGARHGGWATENVVATGVVACRAPSGDECHTIASPANTPAPVQVDARWDGWYLFATQQWGSGNNHMIYIPEAVGPSMLAEPVHGRSAALGPVCCAPPPAAAPEPAAVPAPATKPPEVMLRRRALRSGARVTVGRVRCTVRCRVELSVSDGRRTLRRTYAVRGTQPLSIVRGQRLRGGTLKVTVTVDGRRLAAGRVR